METIGGGDGGAEMVLSDAALDTWVAKLESVITQKPAIATTAKLKV